jgi:hypothetical protein
VYRRRALLLLVVVWRIRCVPAAQLCGTVACTCVRRQCHNSAVIQQSHQALCWHVSSISSSCRYRRYHRPSGAVCGLSYSVNCVMVCCTACKRLEVFISGTTQAAPLADKRTLTGRILAALRACALTLAL